jgi:antitoxin component of RelBE/YafQ-DinJ toxin-antitoxin module
MQKSDEIIPLRIPKELKDKLLEKADKLGVKLSTYIKIVLQKEVEGN